MRFIAALLAFLALVAGGNMALAHGPEGHGGKRDDSAVAGAPAGQSESETAAAASKPSAASPGAPGGVAGADQGDAQSEPDWGIGDALRAFHPASVHFPIAFFLLAGLLEAFAVARSRPGLHSTVDILVVAGAIGAGLAAMFGWIHTGLWFGGDLAMQWHRWTGTGIALAGFAGLVAVRGHNRAALRVLLAGLCVALLLQGYWGGELAHGPNHLGAH